MSTNDAKKRPPSLIGDFALSWSMDDVLNDDLYKGQVNQIPETFSCPKEYLRSFVTPLVEETRSDLCSSLTTLSESLCCKIKSVKQCKDFEAPQDLFYDVTLHDYVKKKKRDDDDDDDDDDDHGTNDLVAITNVKPKWYGDLNRPGWPYLIALVEGVGFNRDSELELRILASRPIYIEDHNGKSEDLYAVKLINMTTNIRIWSALFANPVTGNMNIIQNVLQPPFQDTDTCTLCHCEENCGSYSNMKTRLLSSDLNESQKNAVLSCIDTKQCHHKNTVRLIWGPPGTGKTKTVGFLLHTLLMMKCRSLTCAPTNVAVVQVTKRLVKGVVESSPFKGYGLGDVVLFGNVKRMKLKNNHPELYDVFLDHRVSVLYQCHAPMNGWSASLLSMISLLEDPEKQYQLYLKDIERKKEEKKKLRLGSKNPRGNKKLWMKVSQTIESNKKMNKLTKDDHEKQTEDVPLSFEEFVRKNFNKVAERLYFCVKNLCIHLPTSHISVKTVRKMSVASDSLKRLANLLGCISDEELRTALKMVVVTRSNRYKELNEARTNCVAVLKSLPLKFLDPLSSDNCVDERIGSIREFCLENAFLIFCTVSSSARLQYEGLKVPFELLIVDEAAQLKECESTIPLLLPGIRQAILIGDEKQLPAMVKSKISENANFGRSLFERVATLGHKKLLLNVQHRMHPSISLFPNQEFYDDMVLDGENVKLETYGARFLPGEMYGSYSFINVPQGKEEFDRKHSRRNTVEIAVVYEIVSNLHKEFLRTKKKVRVGVISPYKAQVHAITEKFGKRYSSHAQSEFSLTVRSVDGFQGGEEDVIIISTVRCNVGGSVGFLSNRQRANVALTRARHCLWIVGSGTTLGKSASVWKKLIADAKERRCFHNAEEDPNLAQAVISSLLELRKFDALDSLLFRDNPKWKVSFTNEFWGSIGRVRDDSLRKKVLSIVERLASGWRLTEKKDVVVHNGSSSLFVEHYEVNEQLYLVWAVDIVRESSTHYTQSLKVWDVSKVCDIPKLVRQLDAFYGSFTVDQMSRYKHKLNEGNLIVPMRWPVQFSGSREEDLVQSLYKPLASLSLKDEPDISSVNERISKTRFTNQKERFNGTGKMWRAK